MYLVISDVGLCIWCNIRGGAGDSASGDSGEVVQVVARADTSNVQKSETS